jgi:hypothetical protein
MKTFDAFVFPDLSGSVIVHDRYQNYDAIPGVVHQLCTQHILRDLEDAAQAYPGAIWPGQAADALRALIHAANAARAEGLAAVPADAIAADLKLFRNAVLVGLVQVRRVPGANTKQKPGRMLLECLKNREADVLRFLTDLRIPPTSTRPSATCGRRKPSRRSPDGSAPRQQPATGTPSAATSTPRASTTRTSSPPSATPSPGTPGCPLSPHEHSPAHRQSHSAIENNAAR